MERYKATISNTKLYQEIELPPDARSVPVGTGKTCMVRVSKDLFFEEFEFHFENRGDGWTLVCGENNYISTDGILKLASKDLVHGDSLILKYKASNLEIFHISFTIDFDYDTKDYERVIDITGRDSITIGGVAGCPLLLRSPLIGGDTVILQRQQGRLVVYDNNAKYGVYVNGAKITREHILQDYDFFSVLDYSFYYKFDRLYTSKSSAMEISGLPHEIQPESAGNFEYPLFNRNTRIEYPVPDEAIPVLDPPQAPQEPEQNIVMSLMPALAMIALVVVVRGGMLNGGGGMSNNSFILFSVCSMGMGIVTTIMGLINAKRKYKKDLANRKKSYLQYIADKRAFLDERRIEERNTLEDIYYSAGREVDLVTKFSSDLFNRTPDDHDFLYLRTGTGSLPSKQPVGYKEQERFESLDELVNIPSALAEEYKYISKVPIVADAKTSGAIGIVGARPRLYELMKNLLLDISTRQYYNDVQVFFMSNEEHAQKLAWIRLLPHLNNEQLGMRNFVCDDESRNILFEYLYKLLSAREAAKVTYPHMVIFVYDDMGIKSHPISTYIEKAKDLGITFLFFEEQKDYLPLGCQQVILLSGKETSGTIVSSSDNTQVQNFSFDPIADGAAAEFVQKLAPVYCEEISLESTLTKNISFFELLNIFSVQDLNLAERWGTSEIYKSMGAPLGVKSKSEIVELNLHEKFHGPHGLVAGTTGSGKSEILQSYILSMATLFHPYEAGFVIIDFKGGGMVNQFKDLPHLVGAITNIDGREIDRSLLSIKAELRKRQTLFAQHDVNHIDAYIKLFKKGQATTPLPHLILIVDEFAELKMDQPEFMKELVSAARIGRSLGVHLILATQKPSGVVDAQIWSNSKFKLCLKVQNKEDSNEVLKSPLAAEIKEPGRAYLQVGNNEIFELFQSAYSGAPAGTNSARKKSFKVHSLALSGKKSLVFEQKPEKSSEENVTQLDAVVDYVAAYCNDHHIERLPGICLPPLEDLVYASALQDSAVNYMDGIQIPLGIKDDPEHQSQAPYVLNFSESNTYIIGAAQMGKTTLLQLIIYQMMRLYTPQEVNIYVVDCGNMALKVFETAPHVGGVALAAEEDRVVNLFKMLSAMVADRKNRFAEKNLGTFSSYIEAGFTDIPQVFLFIDNMSVFRELYEKLEDPFLALSREGLSVGINIIATGAQTNAVGYRLLANYGSRIAFTCNDRSEYSNIFDRCRTQPKEVAGRALCEIDKRILEFQTAIPFEGEKEIERVENMKAFITSSCEKYPGQSAPSIPKVPDILVAKHLLRSDKDIYTHPYKIPVGLDYDSVTFRYIDLMSIGLLGIAGREKAGKTNFLEHLIFTLHQQILTNPVELYIIDNGDASLKTVEHRGYVKEYADSANSVVYMVDALAAKLEDRQAEVSAQHGKSADDVLKNEPLLLLLIDNPEVLKVLAQDKPLQTKLISLFKQYRRYKFCMVFGGLENTAVNVSAPDILKAIKENRQLLMFEDIEDIKMFDISLKQQRAFPKPISLGDTYFWSRSELSKIKTIQV